MLKELRKKDKCFNYGIKTNINLFCSWHVSINSASSFNLVKIMEKEIPTYEEVEFVCECCGKKVKRISQKRGDSNKFLCQKCGKESIETL